MSVEDGRLIYVDEAVEVKEGERQNHEAMLEERSRNSLLVDS
jgi:hypothetical protein